MKVGDKVFVSGKRLVAAKELKAVWLKDGAIRIAVRDLARNPSLGYDVRTLAMRLSNALDVLAGPD